MSQGDFYMYSVETRLFRDEYFSITTERLRLSVLRKSACRRVTDYVVRNAEFHQKFSQTRNHDYFTVPVQREFLQSDLAAFRKGTLVPFWITMKGEEKIIGRVSFFNLAYGGMMSCATGYHLDKDYTGQGIITEALRGAIGFMFDEFRMHRIEAFILPENEKSLNVVKRLGFTEEGKRAAYMHINGQYRDHVAFYVLNDT